jgi:putative transposase
MPTRSCPNHLHLIASCRAPFRLEAVMGDWKSFSARRIIDRLQDKAIPESRREWLLYLFGYFASERKHKQTYQVWQHDNHPIALYSEHVIAQKLEYIHDNAVKANYVSLPEHWLYSSAPFYAATKEGPAQADFVPLVDISPIWGWFYAQDG